MPKRSEHGWWPYFLPLPVFLFLVEVGRRAPEDAAPFFLVLKAAVPLGLVLYFFRRGEYPELRGYVASARNLALDIGVGVLGGLIWMAPYVLDLLAPYIGLEWLRPDPEGGFDRHMLGEAGVAAVIGLRAVGYGVTVPFVEELFARGWLARYMQVIDRHGDFRKIPVALASRRGFITVVVYWALTHAPWEAPVAIVWAAGTQLWLYHRKSLMSLVVVHAASNLSILAVVAAVSGTSIVGGASLWFFV